MQVHMGLLLRSRERSAAIEVGGAGRQNAGQSLRRDSRQAIFGRPGPNWLIRRDPALPARSAAIAILATVLGQRHVS